jgi:hypothetical protein
VVVVHRLFRSAGCWIVLAVALGLTASATAAAHEPPPDEGPTLTGDVDVGIFAEKTPGADRALVSPSLHLGIRVRPEVELALGGGAFGLFQNGPGGVQYEARPSNLTIGTRFLRERHADRYRHLSAGFAFALPTAFSRSAVDDEAYDTVIGARGGWDAWEWEPTSMAIVFPFAWRGQLARRWMLGLEAAAGGLFASGGSNEPPALVAQVGGEARYALPWFAAGVRLQGVWNGANESDRSQASVVPQLDASLCRRNTGRRIRGLVSRTSAECPVVVSARFTFNLDRPYGFITEDAQRIWGLGVGLGWAI